MVKTIAGFPILIIEIIMMGAIIWYLYANSYRLRMEVARVEERKFEAKQKELLN